MVWSSRTDVHGVTSCDFAALFGCTQQVRGSTHRADGKMSDVPYLCKKCELAAPLGELTTLMLVLCLICHLVLPALILANRLC